MTDKPATISYCPLETMYWRYDSDGNRIPYNEKSWFELLFTFLEDIWSVAVILWEIIKGKLHFFDASRNKKEHVASRIFEFLGQPTKEFRDS